MLVYYRFLYLDDMFFIICLYLDCYVFGKTDMLNHWGVANVITSKQLKIMEAKKT